MPSKKLSGVHCLFAHGGHPFGFSTTGTPDRIPVLVQEHACPYHRCLLVFLIVDSRGCISFFKRGARYEEVSPGCFVFPYYDALIHLTKDKRGWGKPCISSFHYPKFQPSLRCALTLIFSSLNKSLPGRTALTAGTLH